MAKKRKYSLFTVVDSKNVRISKTALPLVEARKHFQSALLAGSLRSINLTLLPVNDGYSGYSPEYNIVPAFNEQARKDFEDACKPTE